MAGSCRSIDSSNPVRKVFESEPGGAYRRQGRPPQRWAKQVDENLRTLGIRNWRPAATARDLLRPRPVTGCNGQISK